MTILATVLSVSTLFPNPVPTASEPPGKARAAASAIFGGLPRVFWVMFAGQVVNRFGAMVLPFLIFYLGSRGFSASEVGLVLATYGLGGLGGQPLGGLLADRIGRRVTLIGGLMSTAIGLAMIGISWNLTTLLVSAATLGLCGDVYRPAAAALIAETVPADRRPKAFGLLHWALNLGAAASGAVAGLLLAHGYWPLFALNAGMSVVFAVIVAVGVPRDGRRGETRDQGAVGYRTAFRDRVVVGVLLLVLVNAIVYSQVRFGLPLALTADGLPSSVYGFLIALNAVLVVVCQPALVAWLSRFARLRVLGACSALVGVGLGLSGVADSPWQYALTVLVWTAGEIGVAGFGAALVADLTPDGAHGTYQALYGWVWAVSRVVGPLVGAALYQSGLTTMWWVCAGCGVVGGLFAVRLGRAAHSR